jgi:16S rRNA (cytidine1402-2'-O)-methyltransferase
MKKKETPNPKTQTSKGNLYLVATPIGNLEEMSPRAIRILNEAACIACEDTRTSGVLLKHFGIATPTRSYHNFNEEDSSRVLIGMLEEGKDIALISDAGYPLMSDPGYTLVQRAIENGITIIPVSGAHAAVNALIASGLPTEHYLFYGFLPSKRGDAAKELKKLVSFPYTLVFYEAPHRILSTLELMNEILGDRPATVARELTKLHEEYIRSTLGELAKRDSYRGELVVVVAGKKEEPSQMSPEELLQRMEEAIAGGMSTKEAAAAVAEESGCSKNKLYNEYLKTKQ